MKLDCSLPTFLLAAYTLLALQLLSDSQPHLLDGSGTWALGVGEERQHCGALSLQMPTCIPVWQLRLPTPVLVMSRDAACSCQAGQVFHQQVFPDGLMKCMIPKKFIQGVSFNSRLVIKCPNQLPVTSSYCYVKLTSFLYHRAGRTWTQPWVVALPLHS